MKRDRRRRGGFSLAELLVVTGIVAILVAILLPYLEKVREQARRQTCAENLNVINGALHAYADLNKNFYPRTIYDSKAHPTGYTAFTGADATDPFAKDTTVAANDVTASLWLLVRGGLVSPKRFVCPSTIDEPDPLTSGGLRVGVERRSNFTSGHFLSYSYASPFSNAKGYVLNDTQPADFALMADKNPGAGSAAGPPYDASDFDLARANSPNHFQAGQNVLYADGHVSFQPTPYCGWRLPPPLQQSTPTPAGAIEHRDNIYTARASRASTQPSDPLPPPESNGVGGHDVGPAAATDSYLVPTKDD